MNDLINKYGISFENAVWNFNTGKEIGKIVRVNDATFREFLNDWSAQEIDELLLPDIEEALTNLNAEMENGSETVYIYIYNETVKFYKINDRDPDKIFSDYLVYELPTQDFKEIVLLWRDFLQTPPLNGTRV